ncbi:MAG: SBBP repeat-containing protein, partial [Bryobacteraceae bacterium]
PRLWRRNLPLYGRVVYRRIYPGIDAVFRGEGGRLKTEFVVAPGADPSRIRMEWIGASAVEIDAGGSLVVRVADGELREEPPYVFQKSGPVQGDYKLLGDRTVGFRIGPYDRRRELVIDPGINYSTYLGGGGIDKATGIAVDSSQNAYVTGYTDSTNLPATGGAFRTVSGGGVDAWVAKLNPSGTALVYLTYLGGLADDRAFSIAVDSSGNAYVAGWTTSSNFPVSSPYQSFFGGVMDAWVAKLNPSGSGLVFCTYLGGAGSDTANGIALYNNSTVMLTGTTASTNFPLAAPFQNSKQAGDDAFVTRFNPWGTALDYSTYLGGAGDDRGASIAVDSAGGAFVTGTTTSSNFPLQGAVQAVYGGAQDAFVTKLNPNGLTLAYSTYLGGSGTESVEVGRSLALDASGSAYVTGTTASTNFPVAAALYATHRGGVNDVYVTKLAPIGGSLSYSTYLGGIGLDSGTAIAVDSTGRAHVTGYTNSGNFPVPGASQPAIGGAYDAFVTQLVAAGNQVVEGDFVGGSGIDSGFGVALDGSGSIYLAGQTVSPNFPLLNPIQSSAGGTHAAFVTKLTLNALVAPTPVSVTPSSGTGLSQTFTYLFSHPSGFANIQRTNMIFQTVITAVNSCYIEYFPATNMIQLATNDGAGYVGSATLGSSTTLANSQCSINVGASSASPSGTNLTVNVALTFSASAFAGTQNSYMAALSTTGAFSGGLLKGTWTVPLVATPAPVSVTPASGGGLSQTFTLLYSDGNGFTDIARTNVIISSTITGVNSCYIEYFRATNLVQLATNDGTGYVGALPIGTAGSLANSQCSINTGASSASGSGSNLTVTLAITFSPNYVGGRSVFMAALDQGGLFSGWQTKGSWVVDPPPATVSVTPASGAGIAQTITAVVGDLLGYTD